MTGSNYAAYGALCAAVLFWGLSFTATKVALESLSPLSILFGRFALACLLLLPVIVRRGPPRLSLAGHAKVAGIAVLFPGCYFVLETHALRLTSAVNASLIAASVPMAVLALTAAVERSWPSWKPVSGVFASLCGVAMLVGIGSSSANAGDAMMLGAVASAAAYMVASAKLCRDVSPIDLTAMQMLWGAAFFLPFFLADLPDASAVSVPGIAAVACLSLFATVAAFLAYNFALSKLSAPTASLFINAVPLVAVLGARLVLGESVSPVQLAGGAVILASVYATAARPTGDASLGQSACE